MQKLVLEIMEPVNIVWEKPLVSQNGSLYIGIPRTWIILHGLKKGDNVKLKLLADGNLKILVPQISHEENER